MDGVEMRAIGGPKAQHMVVVGGNDGTNDRAILTDPSGRIILGGSGGSAIDTELPAAGTYASKDGTPSDFPDVGAHVLALDTAGASARVSVMRAQDSGGQRTLGVGIVPTNVTAGAPLNATSTAEEASRVAKASAGTLYGFTIYNNNAAVRYVQLFDSATLPADGVVPVLTYEVAAQASRAVGFGPYGRRFSTGIVICNSSTDTTKTIGSADSLFDVQYV